MQKRALWKGGKAWSWEILKGSNMEMNGKYYVWEIVKDDVFKYKKVHKVYILLKTQERKMYGNMNKYIHINYTYKETWGRMMNGKEEWMMHRRLGEDDVY